MSAAAGPSAPVAREAEGTAADATRAVFGDGLTWVRLVWIEDQIEQWIRFGRVAQERIVDRRTRIVGFRTGTPFAFVRWASNAHGTIVSRIDIVLTVRSGAGYKPAFLPGFHAGLTWYNVDYRDRIASPSAQIFNFLVNRPLYVGITQLNPSAADIARYFSAANIINPLNIPQTAPFVAAIDARLQNLSVVKESGLDLDAGYGFDVSGGHAEIGATATYIFFIKQSLTDTAPSNDVVSILGNPVDFKARGRVSWTSSHVGAVAFANFVGNYTKKSNAAPQRVSSWTTLDLQLSYRFDNSRGPFKGLQVALNATNLFDRDPPYAAYYLGSLGSAYDPENANPLKRAVSFQVTKRW